MTGCRPALLTALALLTIPGIAAAQSGVPQTSTQVTPGAPVISADSPPARNPAINPSAAGLIQGQIAAPNPAASAGNGQQTAGRGEISEAQARRWLRYYHYKDITNLHVNQQAHWQAQATLNGRRVRVVLDDRGTVTELK